MFLCIVSSGKHQLSCDDYLEDMRKDYQNCSVLYCVIRLYTVISTHIWAVLTGVTGVCTRDCWLRFRHLVYCFCVFQCDLLILLAIATVYFEYFFVFWCIFSCLCWVVGINTGDFLERLVSKMTFICWVNLYSFTLCIVCCYHKLQVVDMLSMASELLFPWVHWH